ncbi:nucleotide sugar dehydrogenase [bacterium]|nr:nucleotide sugar dehydrogenase [bacterium]
MKVAVIGAGGHVGFPFACVVAEAGHTVYGIDINQYNVDCLTKGIVPYVEEGAGDILRRNLDNNRLLFTTDFDFIKDADVIAIMIGTPVDGEGNARLDDLFNFVDDTLIPRMRVGQLIVLRSTVSPGTTEVLRKHIHKKHGWAEGADYHLVFCPERVVQGKSIVETTKLPQIVGAFTNESYFRAKVFFSTFITNQIFHLTPKEAEIGKLMTNMYRYVTFAFANEFWMIGEKHGVNIDKVIDACNYDYPRMDVPHPGPNVGGPCLFKDGRFLLSDIPFGDLINTSFLINEGMPDYIFNRIKTINPNVENVLILGATFKKNCDDTRNSLSFKMKKVCKKHGVNAYMVDPMHIEDMNIPSNKVMDVVIVMTPHDDFLNPETFGYKVKDFKQECIIADLWKMFPESKISNTGIYKVGDVK